MKQKIVLLLALLLTVSMMTNLTACKKTVDESEPSASEPSTSESTEPSETTPPATEPTEDYKDDIAYYPFPLLNMTYGEIMKKYPDAVVESAPQYTARLTCKQIPGIDVVFDLRTEYDEKTNPIPWDLLPCKVKHTGEVYPGMQVGMKHGEIDFETFPNHELLVGNGQDIVTFTIYEKIEVEEYTIYVYMGNSLSDDITIMPWDVVEKYLGYALSENEAFEQAINGGEIIRAKDIQDWLQDGNMDEIANLKIRSIKIYRNNNDN